ncbi:hypothetical protein SUGI_0030500 [Cryptomeria japonica]|nr:hypothetical protein SUGI_0030500 [Cryptomeria japonica]
MSPDTEKTHNLEEKLAAADGMISKWDTKTTNTMLFQSNPLEAGQYLTAIQNLQQLMEKLSVVDSSSAKMIRAEHLMQMSMARLRNEFHNILLSNSDPIDRSGRFSVHSSMEGSVSRSSCFSSDDDATDEDGGGGTPLSARPSIDRICDLDTIPLGAVEDLRNIVQSMASAGYGRECVRVFAVARKSVVEESLYNLGVEKVSLNDVQKMEWASLEDKIRKWISAAKISIQLLFAREKWLCDQVFEGFTQLRDSGFADVAKDPAARLLSFAEAVAASRRAPETMFKVLDMYETLTEIIPDINEIFCENPCKGVQKQAAQCLVLLGEAVWGILTEFENSLEKESSKAAIPGGAVHPLTRYVVNYLVYLYDYKETFLTLTADKPMDLPKGLAGGFAPGLDDDVDVTAAPLSIRLGWIAVLLQCKIDAKSKLYKEPALSYLFLMNNLHYIVEKVKGSELKSVLGDKWLWKQCNTVRQYAVYYERAAWSKVLSLLAEEGISGVSQQALKDRFKAINVTIEGVIKSHEGWVVHDVRLREDLGISISQRLMPAYRSFLGRFERRLDSGRHSHSHVKYTADELENLVLDLFKGGAAVSSRRSHR